MNGKASQPGSSAASSDDSIRQESSQEQNFQNIVADAPLGIFQSTTDRLVMVNPALARLFGCSSPEEMLEEGAAPARFFVRPADRAEIIKAVTETDGFVQRVVEYRRRDGSTFTGNLHMRRKPDATGKTNLVEGFVEDITGRLRLEKQLRQAQKMEAIGQLAGGIAHDFNNILAAILMHLGVLQEDSRVQPDLKEALGEIEEQTQRAANLTRQLLLFSRRQVPTPEVLNVNVLLKDLLKMLRRLLGEKIRVTFRRAEEEAWVRGDAGMLEQVVMNLCINARDAMLQGGELAISVATVEARAENMRRNPDARPGRFVRLSVADNGCGMDEAVLKRLFEPFFTTKEPGKGTGLGLATVYGIIKQHEGWVDVESTIGLGSVFRVHLPAVIEPAKMEANPLMSETIRGGTETILLVEDERSVRQTVALCLRKLGYAVLEADNGSEALGLWKQNGDRIQLLISDMVMPGELTGQELAEGLLQQKPSLKAILSSGYSAELAENGSVTHPALSFLAKPYRAALLAKTVRLLLDEDQKSPGT